MKTTVYECDGCKKNMELGDVRNIIWGSCVNEQDMVPLEMQLCKKCLAIANAGLKQLMPKMKVKIDDY